MTEICGENERGLGKIPASRDQARDKRPIPLAAVSEEWNSGTAAKRPSDII